MQRLKELRKKDQLTLDQLGNILGISRQVLSRYERGEHEADYATLKKIASYFNVSIDYLLGYSNFYHPDAIKNNTPSKEIELLSMFRKMNTAQQNRFLGIAEGMIEEATKFKKQ